MANPFYGSGPLRSREGLVARPVASSDEIQLRIDPIHGDLDDEITGLRKQIRQLKGVAQEIGTEAKFQSDFINQLNLGKCAFLQCLSTLVIDGAQPPVHIVT